jgi:glycerate kinase
VLKILIAPDKFKGTLTAAEAAAAIARGWRKARPRDELELLPISDGGDGFGEVFSGLLRAKRQTLRTIDAAHRDCRTHWWWEPKSKTAIIESANIIGLAMLPPGKFHPFDLDTFGLGAAIRAASAKGARRCIVGIGGSATNDGGFGLARALGWKFFDAAGDAIERWTQLRTLAKIQSPRRRRWFAELVVAVDVRNLLLGVHGATRVYGPQKGLRGDDFRLAESCLRRLAEVFTRQFGKKLGTLSGSGAAGGLGFGLMAFGGARIEPGFEMFARFAKLSQRLGSANLVITGEGRIDSSTFMGKAAGQIAEQCRVRNIPCLGLAGETERGTKANRVFQKVLALTDLTTASDARARPAYWLERLAATAPHASECGSVNCTAVIASRKGRKVRKVLT